MKINEYIDFGESNWFDLSELTKKELRTLEEMISLIIVFNRGDEEE